MSEDVFIHLHTGYIESISGESLSSRVSKGLLRCLLSLVLLHGSKPFWPWSFICEMILFSPLPKAFPLPHCSELAQFYFGEQSSIQLRVHYLSHVLHFGEIFHDFLSQCCFFFLLFLSWNLFVLIFWSGLSLVFLSIFHLSLSLPSDAHFCPLIGLIHRLRNTALCGLLHSSFPVLTLHLLLLHLLMLFCTWRPSFMYPGIIKGYIKS